MSNIAISYARFSSGGQAAGGSLSRQIERAAEYASAHGLVLDPALSFRDLGLSGWDLTNVEKGDLGVFLKAIADNKIPKGATMIIESFDRLSRAEPIDAVGIFQQIITAGLNLVTLTEPPKRFSRQTLKDNPFQFHEALLDMHRANAESNRKSDLIRKSWEQRRKRASETKVAMTSKAPHWIKAEGPPRQKRFVLIPERVAVVKKVLGLAMAGVGNHTIIKTLHAEGVPSWSRSQKEDAKRAAEGRTHSWEPSYIQKMLSQPALYGAVKIKGDVLVEGYYPPVITKDEYTHLQSLRRVRSKRAPSTRQGVGVTNLFSGLLYCGYCGSKMIVSSYRAKDGRTHRYIACHGARTGKTECRMHGWELKKLEREVLNAAEEVNFGRALGQPKHEAEEQVVALLEQQAHDLKTKIERVFVAIEEGAESMVPRLKQLEADLGATERTLRDKQQELAALQVHRRGIHVDEVGLLRVKMAKLERKGDEIQLRALREQLSNMIAQSIDRITLHPVGRGKVGAPSLDLTFKGGSTKSYTPEYVEF